MRNCMECGAPNPPRSARRRAFCSDQCRQAFNRRRAHRGSILYDLMMLRALDQDAAERFNLDSRIENALAAWRIEDAKSERSRSHKALSEVVADTMMFLSKTKD